MQGGDETSGGANPASTFATEGAAVADDDETRHPGRITHDREAARDSWDFVGDSWSVASDSPKNRGLLERTTTNEPRSVPSTLDLTASVP